LGKYKGNSTIPMVWVYSSQALTKPSGLPDLLVALVRHGAHLEVVEHLIIDRNLVCFIRSEGSINDSVSYCYYCGIRLIMNYSVLNEAKQNE
jgi:hypothetical protein